MLKLARSKMIKVLLILVYNEIEHCGKEEWMRITMITDLITKIPLLNSLKWCPCSYVQLLHLGGLSFHLIVTFLGSKLSVQVAGDKDETMTWRIHGKGRKSDTYSQKKYKLATVVESDPTSLFSIATTPRCRGDRYSFPWIAPLYSWSVLYNAEC